MVLLDLPGLVHFSGGRLDQDDWHLCSVVTSLTRQQPGPGISSHSDGEVQEKRTSVLRMLFHPLLVSHSLTFHLPQQVSWLGPQHLPTMSVSYVCMVNVPVIHGCLMKYSISSLLKIVTIYYASQSLWVRNSGRGWLSYSFDSRDIRGTQLVDGLVWVV